MDKGCLTIIGVFALVVIVYASLAEGDKGGFDSIGRFFVFMLFLAGLYALIKYVNNNKK